MRGIIILFKGGYSDNTISNAIAETLLRAKVEENASIDMLSEEDVDRMIIGASPQIKALAEEHLAAKLQPNTPEDVAAAFLGVKLGSIFESNLKGVDLVKALTNAIKDMRNDIELRSKVLNSMKILGNAGSANKTIMKKYHLTVEKIKTIKDTYYILV